LAAALSRSGVDMGALGLAWARAMPAVMIVPAFGLRAIPAPTRAIMGLALAGTVFPALRPEVVNASEPWALLALGEAVRGLPLAVAAAVPLWAATTAGALADSLRGSPGTTTVPTVEGQTSALGIPFSLLGCALFLATGGPARIATALALRPVESHPALGVATDLVSGITLALSLGAPLVAASVVLEAAAALMARAASPAHVHALIAPVRALCSLAVFGLVVDRIATFLAKAVAAVP
jgi:type III secretory pathway component EscT